MNFINITVHFLINLCVTTIVTTSSTACAFNLSRYGMFRHYSIMAFFMVERIVK